MDPQSKKVLKAKGVILAGGNGVRLRPLTYAINKHFIPLYDKPMIYYPLSTLMLAGLREIFLITRPEDRETYLKLLGDGSKWGMNITYIAQTKPRGVADSLRLLDGYINSENIILILGDNFFYGKDFIDQISKSKYAKGAKIFAYKVTNPSSYGIVQLSNEGNILSLEEKPEKPKSKNAITGIYMLDETAILKAKHISVSDRGELEIIDLLNLYKEEGLLNVEVFGRGTIWFDAGTIDDLYEASSFVRTLEKRNGGKIGCPEEIAWRLKWISTSDLKNLISEMSENRYQDYLIECLKSKPNKTKLN